MIYSQAVYRSALQEHAFPVPFIESPAIAVSQVISGELREHGLTGGCGIKLQRGRSQSALPRFSNHVRDECQHILRGHDRPWPVEIGDFMPTRSANSGSFQLHWATIGWWTVMDKSIFQPRNGQITKSNIRFAAR